MAKQTKYGNRGMNLEEQIILSNLRYETLKLAIIKKVATPIKVVKKEKKKIIEAYFQEKSTVDFEGNIKGRFVAFDAKETKKDHFPLSNLENHQYKYLEDNHEQNGLAFLLIYFTSYDAKYILTFEQLKTWWKPGKKKGLGDIPYEFFKSHCKRCEPGRNLAIDYLSALEI